MYTRALHTHPQLPTILAIGALVLAAMSSAAGLFVPDLYRDTEAWIREAQATDLVTLLGAVPVLAGALWLARRGDGRGDLVAIGALGYLAYSYAIFAFTVVPNPLSLLYIAVLGLAGWSLVLRLGVSDQRSLADLSPRLPRRTTSVFLLTVPILFGLLWLGDIVGTVSADGPTEVLVETGLPTNPIWALDLAFALPAVFYAGIRLMRSDARALATALPALAFLVLIGFAVLGVFVFDAVAGAAIEPAPVIVVSTITAVALGLGVAALLPRQQARPVPSPSTLVG
jgi:hypothetical protein